MKHERVSTQRGRACDLKILTEICNLVRKLCLVPYGAKIDVKR